MNNHNSVVTVVLQNRGCAKAEPNHWGATGLVGLSPNRDQRDSLRLMNLCSLGTLMLVSKGWQIFSYLT